MFVLPDLPVLFELFRGTLHLAKETIVSDSNSRTFTITYVVEQCTIIEPDGSASGWPPLGIQSHIKFPSPDVQHLDEEGLLASTQDRLTLLSQVSEVVALSNHQYSRAVNMQASKLGIEFDLGVDTPISETED